MLYHLLYPLRDIIPAFNVFRYITFRVAAAIVTALLLSWLLVWFQRHKAGFFPNVLKVLAGIYSWVGYGMDARKDLPALRPSVFSPADMLDKNVPAEKLQIALLNYAKDYKIENDLRIVLSGWRELGR